MESLWRKDVEIPDFPTLKGDKKTDVLIIGGGISGLLTAYFLHGRGVRYILVEKDRICSGTTQNTTAKITFQHGLVYQELLKSYGTEKAKMYLEANRSAFHEYERLCKKIDCNYEVKDNYVYSLDSRERIEKEMSVLDKIGYNAELFDTLPLPMQILGAVCFPNQAQFHPLKFLSHIAKCLNVYEHTFVREMIGNTAVTDFGKIYAQQVIVTTHFPFINKHGLFPLKLYQHRSYVLALKDAQQVGGMFVDESKTGMSFRNYGDLLLLGGGDHRTGKQGGNWTELRSFTAQQYPQAVEVASWAAQDCMSLDSMPYIGRYSKNTSELFVASGFNKWGMTSAMLAAMILSDAVANKYNEYSKLFLPERSIFKPQLFINSAESIINLLSFSQKRCPHLGCALKWNSAEHSWDCPCHGSRFDENGKVLDNPANGDLKDK